MDAFEAPVLPEGAPWRCPMCGESYQFVNHPFCMKKALQERDEARMVARWILHWFSGMGMIPEWERDHPWLKEQECRKP